MICFVVILHCSFSLGIVDVNIFVWWNSIELKVLSVDFITPIWRGIIHDDCIVVGIVLCKDCVEIILYSKLNIVEIARSQDTNRQFFWVGLEIVDFIEFVVVRSQHLCFLLIATSVYFVVEHSQRQDLLNLLVLFNERFSLFLKFDSLLSHLLSGVQDFIYSSLINNYFSPCWLVERNWTTETVPWTTYFWPPFWGFT